MPDEAKEEPKEEPKEGKPMKVVADPTVTPEKYKETHPDATPEPAEEHGQTDYQSP